MTRKDNSFNNIRQIEALNDFKVIRDVLAFFQTVP